MASRQSQVLDITEKVWQKQVEGLAKTLGYTKIYHTFFSRWSDKGFPDLVLVKPNRLIFAELKREKGKLTDSQREWLKALEEAGAECYVWYPHQWDEIAEILRRKPEGISLEVNRVTCQKMTGVASGTTVETSEGERA